ncbi:unnamed protein product [Clonostachys chloroleuca]|uniref:Zn(2)-C6 fungal-type domain-containing protein n=1 Tax=Clonostachys chloroleuca TaxID=1926264 RepID=A0AA35MJ11_9HYPO|nr:unnamed protein product [Clonostachys chloroleuca]
MSGRAKVATCVNCRQMKVRCDAKELFPAACSRCGKKGLRCFIDPSFQRTAKRKRAEELEKELRKIKATSFASTSNTSAAPEDNLLGSPAEQPRDSLVPSSAYPEYSSAVPSSAFATERIGEIEVSPAAIAEIITAFFSFCHEDFPILPDLLYFVRGYNRCKFLFWVVIAIGSKSTENHEQLYTQLRPHIRLLVSDLDGAVEHALGTVQALLLLCWWPFPFQATRSDPSWSYSGLAVHTALRAGIHRPHHFSDFMYNDRLDDAGIQAFRKAWIGCFIVNQLLASELGVPSTVSVDNTIVSALDGRASGRLPKPLEQHLRIAYHSYNICNTLGNSDATTSGLVHGSIGIIKILQKGLQELEIELAPDMTTHTALALLRVKLQLQSFVFTDDQLDRSDLRIENRAADHLSKVETYSTKIIDLAAQAAPVRSAPHIWTITLRTSVVYAAHILLRLVAYSENLDVGLIQNSIGQAWMLFNSQSELENDSWARLREIITYLSRIGTSQNTPGAPSVRARMSANIAIESIWRARGRFSEEVLRERPSDYTEAEAMRDLMRFGLDLIIGDDPFEETDPTLLQDSLLPVDDVFGGA